MNSLIETIQRLTAEMRAELKTRIGDELARSDRAKVMVAAVGGILLLSLWITLGAISDHAKRDYRAAQISLARLRAQVDTGAWAERRAQSEATKLALEERFWIAQTPGLAEAGFERFLRDHLSPYKIEPQQIQVRRVALVTGTDAQARGSLANMERMTAKLMMPFDQAALLGFLGDIAESERAIVIDRMIVRAGRNARIEIDVSAFYPARDKGR